MIHSSETKPILPHHMTWIHNSPKCDSCVVRNDVENGHRDTQFHHHHPCPHHPTTMATHHSNEALHYQSFPPDDVNDGKQILPEIVRGRSIQRRPRYSDPTYLVGRFASYEQARAKLNGGSNFLPRISQSSGEMGYGHYSNDGSRLNKAQARLSKSLDLEDRYSKQDNRRMSLPSLSSSSHNLAGSWRTISGDSVTDSGVFDSSTDDHALFCRVSLDDSESDEEDESPRFIIDPFPYQTDRTPFDIVTEAPSPKPPTPEKPKKKKKKKPPPPPPPKPRVKKPKKPYQPPKRPVNLAALRRHEQEVAKRHPIKKQFLYSSSLEKELQSYMPPRLPGGKLKSVYKRSETGDIMFPDDPIIVQYNQLLTESDLTKSDSPWSISRRRQEALQAFLDRKRKVQKHISAKIKTTRVRFTLPPGHVDSGSETGSADNTVEANHHVASGDRIQSGTSGQSKENHHENNPQEDKGILLDSENTAPPDQQDVVKLSSSVATISHEALRELESVPTGQTSDQIVHSWLQTAEDNKPDRGRTSGEKLSITDQFEKLPIISETEILPNSPRTFSGEIRSSLAVVEEDPNEGDIAQSDNLLQ